MRGDSAERLVDVPGGRLWMAESGAGPAIVLLHAGIVDSRSWEPLVPHLVAADHRVVRYDRRGFGRSVTEDVAYSNRADLVALLDVLDIGRACLVGNSQGGQIAADVACEFPDRVAALVLAGATISGYEPEPTAEEARLFAQMELLEEAADDPDAMVDLALRVWVDGQGQPADRVPTALREAVRTMAGAAADPSVVHGQPIPLEPPAAERLATMTMPVLAVAGALDVSDVWATAEHLARACPDGRAVRIPRVAHMVGMEAAVVLARLITGLLEPLGDY